MELTGKKVNFLGDSITEGCCATRPELGYVEVVKRIGGLAAARNYGISGTRIARQHSPYLYPEFDRDFCIRAAEMDRDADLVLVFGGTNDYGHGDAPLGSSDDQTTDTFCGALNALCKLLKERFPRAVIVLLTPLHRGDEAVPNKNSGATLEDYVNLIRAAAKRHELPLLDLFETSSIRAHIPEVTDRLTVDGLHPNDEGHAILAREIISFLETL